YRYFFVSIALITTDLIASQVKLDALPNLYIQIYKQIIKASFSKSKPSMEEIIPIAAMIAPPGTPGAAIMVTPSIQINPANCMKSMGMPCMIMSATTQATIFKVLPDKCIVAQRGITKLAISSLTPAFLAWAKVTGMVAAEDCVPKAVK